MPNWTDENGYDWFSKLECKRCLQRFETDDQGEVPPHDCIGGRWRSVSGGGFWHVAVRCTEGE
jgi:hypothetical protein